MEEKWKWVDGFEGIYMISNFGRAKSVDRYEKVNGWVRFRKGRVLKSDKKRNSYGYAFRKNSKYYYYQIHRLVYSSFVGDIPDGMQIDHIDRDICNNMLSNLQLVTPRQNVLKTVIQKNNSDRGVTKDSRWNSWIARIRIRGKQIYLGSFRNKDDAIAARLRFEEGTNYYQEISHLKIPIAREASGK